MDTDQIKLRLLRDGFDLELAFDLPARGVVALLGPSGSGKSTVLRAVAGLEPDVEGRIRVAGQDWLDSPWRICRKPQQRRVGMVFQDYALFPHLTIAENVAFGLNKLPAVDRAVQVRHLLDATGLTGMQDRYPHELSGGQQQSGCPLRHRALTADRAGEGDSPAGRSARRPASRSSRPSS